MQLAPGLAVWEITQRHKQTALITKEDEFTKWKRNRCVTWDTRRRLTLFTWVCAKGTDDYGMILDVASVSVCRDILKQCMLNQSSDNSCHSLITWLLIFLRDALYYFFKIIIVLTKVVDRKYLPVSSFTNMIRFQSIVLLILFITSKNKNKREISDVHGDGGHVPTSFVQKRRDR